MTISALIAVLMTIAAAIGGSSDIPEAQRQEILGRIGAAIEEAIASSTPVAIAPTVATTSVPATPAFTPVVAPAEVNEVPAPVENAIIKTMNYATLSDVQVMPDGERMAFLNLGDESAALIVYENAEKFETSKIKVKKTDKVNKNVPVGFGHLGTYTYTITSYGAGDTVVNVQTGTIEVQ